MAHGTTKALRQTFGKGTIPCAEDGLPAVGQASDGKYYCAYHMRMKYGYIPGAS